ncbi:MAG: response regulator, partial [Lachnospiraceae bacterium]|nr:response regulator [Lachnospiraceae bacterium]
RVNNFLANVSHEIRTPINAVVGLSAVMEKESLSPKVLEHVQSISNAGHRVAEQIGDILDYTEIDMDALSVSDETYMIGSLVNDLIVQISHMESYGLDLVIDMDPSIPCELEGDSSKIKKILWHLIDNSYKFTRDGGVNVRIYTIPREYGVNLLIEVTDTGIGMTEEEIEHIYDKFYQSDSGRSRMAGGLGLGIPIVNGFVRSMGGMLTIESKPDEGTVVRVSIPQGVVDDGPCLCVKNREECVVAGYLGFMTTENRRIREFYIEMIAHLSAGLGVPFNNALSIGQLQKIIDTTPVTHLFIGTGEYLENREYIDSISGQMNVAIVADIGYTGTAGGHATLLSKPFYGTQVTNFLNHAFAGSDAAMEKMTTPGLQALVVDDEPMNLIVAKGIFSSYGMIVSTASGGQEALDMCAVKDYDIVFMDHMMPGMDGVEAMKRLKMQASRKNKELCVVALTANAISTAKEMFLSEGFDGFIPKPVEVSELERVLKHVLPRSAIVYENVMDKKAPAASDQNRAGDKDAVMNKNADDQQAKASIEDGSQDVDAFSQLKDMDVDTAQGLSYCQNDASFYIEVLCEYAGNREKKAAELESYIASEDMENYAIRVHAVKSTSKMIGAMALSEQAKALEAAAKDDDRAYVLSAHIPFLKKYKDLMDEISELYMPGNSDQGKMPEDGNGTDGDNPAGEDEFVLEFGPEDDGEGTL